ncbi:MAG: hypothetical protein WED34_04575 [Planctomycetales bacterium]
MQKRERILLVVTAALVLGWFVIPRAYGLLVGPIEERRQQLAGLEQKLRDQRADQARLVASIQLLEGSRRRSLPPQPHDALRLYQAWLTDLAEMSDLTDASDVKRPPRVTPGTPKPHGKVFTSVPVTIEGKGTIEQLGRFLHCFHRADLAHRIEKVDVTAEGTEAGSLLSVNLTAVGLAFPNAADRPHLFPQTELVAELKSDAKSLEIAGREGFPERPGFRVRIGREYLTVTAMDETRWTVGRGVDGTRPLSHSKGDTLELAPIHPSYAAATPADFEKLVKNSPFAKPAPPKKYVPPPPPPPGPDENRGARSQTAGPPPPPPRDRTAEYTYLGGFILYDDRPQARLYHRQTGARTVLHEGDRLKIGAVEGEVVSIGRDHVVVRKSDGTFRLPLGETVAYMERIAGPPLAEKPRPPEPAPPAEQLPAQGPAATAAGPPEPPTVPVDLPDPAVDSDETAVDPAGEIDAQSEE